STSVGGGSDIMSYFLTGNYSDEQGAVDPGEYKTGGFRGNFPFRPIRQLELALNSSYQRGNQQWIPDGNLANGFLLNVARGSAGNYRGSVCANTTIICRSSAAALTIGTTSKPDHYISGFAINYAPVAAWTNRLSIGY